MVWGRWGDDMIGHNLSRRALEVARARPFALVLFIAWLAIEIAMAQGHALFRDEVRALSLAMQSDTIFGTATGVRDGHPPLWHILLRAAYEVTGRYEVVTFVSLACAGAALALLLFRSPFAWPILALIAASRFALFDYSAAARNYGISMLAMFAFATLYEKHRQRGIVLGIVLFLLAISNVHSVILVGGFLLLWAIDSWRSEGLKLTPATKTFALNAGIALAGIAACAASIYPPRHDAAMITWDHGIDPTLILKALAFPGPRFGETVLSPIAELTSAIGLGAIDGENYLVAVLVSALLYAATLGLARTPGALASAIAALCGFSVLFVLVYGGNYRHEALWLVFLISLYWIQQARAPLPLPPVWPSERELTPAVKIGWAAFIALLVLQTIGAAFAVRAELDPTQPYSQSRNFAEFVRSRPDLSDAIIMADPDYLVEALPAYLQNPLYMPREGVFSHVALFQRNGTLSLSVAELHQRAHALSRTYDRPVVLLINAELDPAAPAHVLKEAYNWELRVDPVDVSALLADAEHVRRFEPARTGEVFDAYIIDAGRSPSAQ